MIKIIGFDLDDTLLNSQKKINDKEAILKAIEKGVKIVFCSGRPLVQKTIDYYKELGLINNTYYVAYNGAVIYDVSNSSIVTMNNLENDDILKIYQTIKNVIDKDIKKTISKEGYALYTHYNNVVYTDRHNHFVDLEHLYNNIDVVERMFWVEDDFVAHKFMVGADPADIQILYQKIKDKLSDYECLISMPCFIEVFKKNVDKYQGLVNVAKIYEIKEDEIMAFGDSMNDYSMIKNAHIGIAMGNSVQAIKDVSDFVTDDNDHYGITKALKEYKVI